MKTNNIPSPLPTVLKYLAIGLTIGTAVGSTLAFILYKAYDVPTTLVTAFVLVGVIAGCYYGSVVGYSKYRKDNKLGL